jgi:hypothetical protein
MSGTGLATVVVEFVQSQRYLGKYEANFLLRLMTWAFQYLAVFHHQPPCSCHDHHLHCLLMNTNVVLHVIGRDQVRPMTSQDTVVILSLS